MGELSEVHRWIETKANCRSHERLIAAHEGITPLGPIRHVRPPRWVESQLQKKTGEWREALSLGVKHQRQSRRAPPSDDRVGPFGAEQAPKARGYLSSNASAHPSGPRYPTIVPLRDRRSLAISQALPSRRYCPH